MGGLFSFLQRPTEEPLLAPAGVIEFNGRDGVLYARGAAGEEVEFKIKGCNWFGSEAYGGPPNGLAAHSIEWYLDFLQKHKFNALRLLFNHEHVFKDDIVQTPQRERLLFQKRYVHMFGILAREAAKRGVLVLIACHRIKADAWPGKGLWYDSTLGVSEDRVMQSWDLVTGELCKHWNVLGADLQNEPHSSSWGKNLDTDWNRAAERIGNHVSSRCPRWLIFVEGVGYTPGAPNGDDPGAGIWWGENLIGTRVAPVRLQKQEKLVYTPHVYGPSVYLQKYFQSPFFPNNMPAVWESHFAFTKEMTGRPIIIGEMGGSYEGLDRQWQDWALPYAVSKGFGIFYFALNPCVPLSRTPDLWLLMLQCCLAALLPALLPLTERSGDRDCSPPATARIPPAWSMTTGTRRDRAPCKTINSKRSRRCLAPMSSSCAVRPAALSSAAHHPT